MPEIIVVDHDPDWPRLFGSLRAPIADALGDLALAIEHVGSTAVPRLAAPSPLRLRRREPRARQSPDGSRPPARESGCRARLRRAEAARVAALAPVTSITLQLHFITFFL